MNRNQSISILVFFATGCLFVYALINFNEHLPLWVALIPVVVLSVLIHVIFYDKLFAICADESAKGPVNASHAVKNCMFKMRFQLPCW